MLNLRRNREQNDFIPKKEGVKRVVVYRFSSIGDVALLTPVLRGILENNQDIEIILVTRPLFKAFFSGINNLTIHASDLSGDHGGFKGIIRLAKEIEEIYQPDEIIDLHKVLRTNIATFYHRMHGYRVTKFKKGTIEKTRQIKSKRLKPLIPMVGRYAEPFTRIGIPVNLSSTPCIKAPWIDIDTIKERLGEFDEKGLLIGIAPFAKHKQKVWGQHKTEALIDLLSKKYQTTIFLFGGGSDEIRRMYEIAKDRENVYVVGGKMEMTEEVHLISKLKCMITMDSSNMHIASLIGVTTFSIWGATHPGIGYRPYLQPSKNIIQIHESKLSCRPCSVYGGKKCNNKVMKCMEGIRPLDVMQKVDKFLSKQVYTRKSKQIPLEKVAY